MHNLGVFQENDEEEEEEEAVLRGPSVGRFNWEERERKTV